MKKNRTLLFVLVCMYCSYAATKTALVTAYTIAIRNWNATYTWASGNVLVTSCNMDIILPGNIDNNGFG